MSPSCGAIQTIVFIGSVEKGLRDNTINIEILSEREPYMIARGPKWTPGWSKIEHRAPKGGHRAPKGGHGAPKGGHGAPKGGPGRQGEALGHLQACIVPSHSTKEQWRIDLVQGTNTGELMAN